MPEASQEQMSHADRHDLDKLARWKTGLDSAGEDASANFPACAIFLVSPEDRASHDIFRRYRSVFEELGGGFHHLVIFGQHGVSATQEAFLAEVGMEQGGVPLLAIAPTNGSGDGDGSVYCLELPKGDGHGELNDSQDWGAALEKIRAAASGNVRLSFDGDRYIRSAALRAGSLRASVDKVLWKLG